MNYIEKAGTLVNTDKLLKLQYVFLINTDNDVVLGIGLAWEQQSYTVSEADNSLSACAVLNQSSNAVITATVTPTDITATSK